VCVNHLNLSHRWKCTFSLANPDWQEEVYCGQRSCSRVINLDEVRDKLSEVLDPELGLNVVELGLIYDLWEPEEGDLHIRMTMTTPGCPMHDNISDNVQWAAAQVFGVADVNVEVVWDPPWSPDVMTDEAREKLGM
jgi:metal-sulfur cluster biosynthetic enzyme